MEDWEEVETPCPKCGHEPTRQSPCFKCCGDGEFDDYEEDPINCAAGEYFTPCDILDWLSQQAAVCSVAEGEQCQRCGQTYLTIWAVDDDTWEGVTGITDGSGLYCPACFDELARLTSVRLHWVATPDGWPDSFEGIRRMPGTRPEDT